jgi:hypothetical protein
MFAWYSNVFVLIAFVLAKLGSFKKGLVLSLAAFLLGLQALSLHAVPTDFGNFDVGACDYALQTGRLPLCAPVDHLGVGYYIWLSSFLILSLFCYLTIRSRRTVAP